MDLCQLVDLSCKVAWFILLHLLFHSPGGGPYSIVWSLDFGALNHITASLYFLGNGSGNLNFLAAGRMESLGGHGKFWILCDK